MSEWYEEEKPKEKPITVAALIAKLQTFPPDAYVETQGCDCEGPCDGAELRTPNKGVPYVVLTRDDFAERPEEDGPQ